MPRWTAAPTIVAESLAGVTDPLVTALLAGPPLSGAEVAGCIARSLAPQEDPTPAPDWLLPEQRRSFGRVLAAVRRFQGALLADPVGTGKTYVALAVAAAHKATTCLVPAVLLEQWRRAAATVGVRVHLVSHEQVSRGKLPPRSSGLVIIDESHHFRNHRTRRYQHVAPWLIGRPVLLVSATPVVNRLADLANQLLLAVRDDALIGDGVASLKALLDGKRATTTLGSLVIETRTRQDRRPERTTGIVSPRPEHCAVVDRQIDALSRLHLSRSGPIAGLIRGILLRATGSSPAALLGALLRYQRLLLHARDAARSGQVLDRAELRRFSAELGDQLVWWELFPRQGAETELHLDDLDQLPAIVQLSREAATNGDLKLTQLRELLTNGPPTLIFTTSRDTVGYIRSKLADLSLAWCTGERAGIGAASLPRAAVLGWFRSPTDSVLAPRHLIVTDVAAEGLDLQRAARVVHYDLPWTSVRLEQREGRSVRYGSPHAQVEVIRFAPPSRLDRLLGLETALSRKANLPGRAGLGSSGQAMWRWRDELMERFGQTRAASGVARVRAGPPGLLAGFTLRQTRTAGVETATVLWLESDGNWTEAAEVVEARLAAAAQESETNAVDRRAVREWLQLIAAPIRERLAMHQSRRWLAVEPSPAARRLAWRLQCLIRDAARRRQADRLSRLERGLRFATRGHTAGEAIWLEQLARYSDRELEAALTRCQPGPDFGEPIEVHLTGLLLFSPEQEESC